MQSPDVVLVVLSVLSSIATLVALALDRPVVGIPLAAVGTVLLLVLLLRDRLRPYHEIRRALKHVLDEMKTQGYSPSHVVAFNRQGAVAAGMLAGNLAVEPLIVIPRRQARGDASGMGIRRFTVGEGLTLEPDALQAKSILVAFFLIETGLTLDESLAYLRDRGYKGDVRVAALFATPGALRRCTTPVFTGIASEHAALILKRLPWSFGPYARVPSTSA